MISIKALLVAVLLFPIGVQLNRSAGEDISHIVCTAIDRMTSNSPSPPSPLNMDTRPGQLPDNTAHSRVKSHAGIGEHTSTVSYADSKLAFQLSDTNGNYRLDCKWETPTGKETYWYLRGNEVELSEELSTLPKAVETNLRRELSRSGIALPNAPPIKKETATSNAQQHSRSAKVRDRHVTGNSDQRFIQIGSVSIPNSNSAVPGGSK